MPAEPGAEASGRHAGRVPVHDLASASTSSATLLFRKGRGLVPKCSHTRDTTSCAVRMRSGSRIARFAGALPGDVQAGDGGEDAELVVQGQQFVERPAGHGGG